jgi:hypothetical protein
LSALLRTKTIPIGDSGNKNKKLHSRNIVNMAEKTDFTKTIQGGLSLPPERKIYFNGFAISITPSDVMIVLQNNQEPVAVLNTSHSIAKTLITKLGSLINSYTKDSGIQVYTLDEIQKKLQQSKGNANKSEDTKKN